MLDIKLKQNIIWLNATRTNYFLRQPLCHQINVLPAWTFGYVLCLDNTWKKFIMQNSPVATGNMRILPVRSFNVRILQVMAGKLWISLVMTANMRNSPVMTANMQNLPVMTANMRLLPVMTGNVKFGSYDC